MDLNPSFEGSMTEGSPATGRKPINLPGFGYRGYNLNGFND